MKIIAPRNKLVLVVTTVIVIAGIILAWFLLPQIVQAYRIFMLILLTVLLLLISPLGHARLTPDHDKTKRLRFWPWIFSILALQLCLILVYFGIANVVGHWLPINTSPKSSLLFSGLYYSLIQLGLFPWNIILLAAIAMSFYSYRRNQDAYLSTLLYPIFKSNPLQTWGLIIDSLAKISTSLVIACSLAFMSLLLASLLAKSAMVSGITSATAIVVMVLLIVTFTQSFKRYLKQLFNRSIPLAVSIPILCVFIAAALVILSLLLRAFITPAQTKLPNFIRHFQHFGWDNLWRLFSAAWWLAWTPVIAVFIARISRGYRIRHIILAVLLLPVLISLLFLLLSHHHFQMVFLSSKVYAIIAWLGFIGLLLMIGKYSTLPMLMMCYLPKRDLIKHRDHQIYFRKCVQMSIGFIYLFLPIGILGPGILLFIFTLPLGLLLLLLPIAGIMTIITSRRSAA